MRLKMTLLMESTPKVRMIFHGGKIATFVLIVFDGSPQTSCDAIYERKY